MAVDVEIAAVLVSGKLVGSAVEDGIADDGSVVVTSGVAWVHADNANKRIESVHTRT
jgi:hypothetical protein